MKLLLIAVLLLAGCVRTGNIGTGVPDKCDPKGDCNVGKAPR